MADQTLVEGGALTTFLGRTEIVAQERIVPGEVDPVLYMEHMGRYEFAENFVRGKAVLDVACGCGYGAPMICAAGAKSYIGVDISPEAIKIATDRFRCSEDVTFQMGDVCRLEGIGDASIDVAVSFETIEHLAEPQEFLAELQRVLKPGGVLLISTPNRTVSDPSAGLDWAPANPFHLREWNLTEFVALLEGFVAVDRVLGQLPCPRWKIFKRRAAQHPMLEWLRPAFRAGKRILLGSAQSIRGYRTPVPVEAIGRWHVPTYIVCICNRAGKVGQR